MERSGQAAAGGDLAHALRHGRRGVSLTLTEVAEHLASSGRPVSVSTLSSWERGTHRPERTSSLDALPRLEELYDLPRGQLRELARRMRSDDDTGLRTDPRLQALQEQSGPVPGLRYVDLHAHHHIDADELRRTTEVRAVADGPADVPTTHDLVVVDLDGGAVDVAAVSQCRVAEHWQVDDLLAVRLELGRTLGPDETHLYEYRTIWTGDVATSPRVRHQVTPLLRQLVLQVTFAVPPAAVWWSTWDGPDEEPVDHDRLVVDAEGSVHRLVVSGPGPTLVGVRWER